MLCHSFGISLTSARPNPKPALGKDVIVVMDPENDRLAQLSNRIDAAKARQDTGKRHQDEHYSQAQQAWRMVTELVAGLIIGFGIGYGLDVLLGTGPFLMVIFLLLGLAAGIKTMISSAQEFQTARLREQEEEG